MRKMIAVFVLGLLSLPPSQAFPQDKQDLYLQAVKANPNDSTAHFNLGVYYLKNQSFEQAITEFQKCVQLNSGDQQARELLENCEGIVASSKGDYSSAISHFQNTLKIDPRIPTPTGS